MTIKSTNNFLASLAPDYICRVDFLNILSIRRNSSVDLYDTLHTRFYFRYCVDEVRLFITMLYLFADGNFVLLSSYTV